MPDPEFDHALEQQLIRHEGLSLKPYRCPAGKLTIGVGRNLEDNGISRYEAMLLLRSDLAGVRMALERAIPGFLVLSDRRRLALIDMCFNLGLPRLWEFKRMRSAIAARDFDRAAAEMLDSAWAEQVGRRAQTLAAMMREG